MATYITEDGSVYYENVPEEKRELFPNTPLNEKTLEDIADIQTDITSINGEIDDIQQQ